MIYGSLFSGIGGFDLALDWVGMQCAWQVEIDKYCTKILTKHWPSVPKFRDIKDCGINNLSYVDVICGGWPCQPFSKAGKQEGKDDPRYLWPEMFRIIKELRPTWVIGEQVAGFIKMALDDTLSDLENLNYSTRSFIIPACGVAAPHRRDRVFMVAHAEGKLLHGSLQAGDGGHEYSDSCSNVVCNTTSLGLPDWAGGKIRQPPTLAEFKRSSRGSIIPQLCGVGNGVSTKLDRDIKRRKRSVVPNRVNRLKALGNAVVPQVVYEIAKAIVEIESANTPVATRN
jgi:DNA (cytosine-5)-methyltransferase 1